MDLAYEYLWAAGYDLPPETAKEPPKPKRKRGRKARRK